MKRTTTRLLNAAFVLGYMVSVCSSAFSQQQIQYKYSKPEDHGDGIVTGTLKGAKLDEEKIVAGTNEILKGTYPNIHSLLILRNGRLVYEKYFTGEDIERGKGRLGVVEHNVETLHDMRSVTKSIVGMAVMIAHAQGKIKSLDQSVFHFFPEYAKYAEGDKKTITVKHLLTMSSGLEWNERIPYTNPANSEIQMNRATDPIEFVLSQKLADKVGTVFNYSGGNTQVLAEIVKKATGLPIDDFVAKNLFDPLGITKVNWVKDRNGYPSAASGLRLRSRDLAKIGLMLMSKGKWNGKRIIPAQLVEESVKARITLPIRLPGVPDFSMSYGYQIWLPSYPIAGEMVKTAQFGGNGGQLVDLDAERGVVVVITAGNYDKPWDPKQKTSEQIYLDIIYPALKRPKAEAVAR